MKKLLGKNVDWRQLIKKPAYILIYAYLILVFVIYPFYLRNGYMDIDESKYIFLSTVSKWMIMAIAVGIVIEVLANTENKYAFSIPTVTDCFFLAYLLITVISVVLSIDRSAAISGYTGWYMGGFLIIMLGIMYLFISRFSVLGDGILTLIMVASTFVFILGILNRFSVWPFPIEGSYATEFLSTIGNIGWYCGYISVTAPLGIALYILKTEMSKTERILYIIYLFIVFMTSLTQGADSIFIVLGLMFFLGLKYAGDSSEGLYRWFETVIVFCLAGQISNIIRHVNLRIFTYNSTNMCDIFNDKLTTLFILIPVVCVYVVLKLRRYVPSDKFKRFINRVMIIIPAIIALIVLMAIINTCFIGKTYDSELTGKETELFQKLALKFLYLNEDWGSGRGKAISVGIRIFENQDIFHKLFGVGPDCMGTYIDGAPELAKELEYYFEGDVLTNAHCEPVTSLVNIGILGTVAFYGLLVSFICRCFHSDDKRCLAIAMCIICYIGYNLLNYANILNYPFMILLIAIGENYMKNRQCGLEPAE